MVLGPNSSILNPRKRRFALRDNVRRPLGLLSQRFPPSLRHSIMTLRLSSKAHLIFRWMDVDIHLLKGDLKIKYHHGIPPFHQQGLVTLEDGMGQDAITDEASVNVSKKITGVGKRARRGA